MKDIGKIGILILLFLISNIMVVEASTNTKERSNNDYLVPNGIEVTDDNRDNILQTPAVDETEKVYDFAELLNEEEEQSLYAQITKFIEKHQMDLAVVTINKNNKGSPRVYADDFYDYNNFGIKDTRDGVLFLVDMESREIYMTTTGNAIIMYNDNRIEEALDAVYSYMTNQNYDTGIQNFISKIDDMASQGVPSGNKNAYLDENGNIKYVKKISWLLLMVISLGITGIIMGILVSKNKLVRKKTTAKEYLKRESVKITSISENLIGTNTVRHKIVDSSSSGGSSTHSGSSGISHGGGGHGF